MGRQRHNRHKSVSERTTLKSGRGLQGRNIGRSWFWSSFCVVRKGRQGPFRSDVGKQKYSSIRTGTSLVTTDESQYVIYRFGPPFPRHERVTSTS